MYIQVYFRLHVNAIYVLYNNLCQFQVSLQQIMAAYAEKESNSAAHYTTFHTHKSSQ